MSELAKQLIEKEKLERTGKLELGRCGLTDLNAIPELFELEWLEELILWDGDKNSGDENILKEIPVNIKKLRNLKTFGYSGTLNTIWEIPSLSPLSELSNLEYLIIGCSTINNLEHLQGLSNLYWLSLEGVTIQDAKNILLPHSLLILELIDVNLSDLSFLKENRRILKLLILGVDFNALEPISYLQRLVHLEVSGLKEEDYIVFEKLKNLEYLKLYKRSSGRDLSFNFEDIHFDKKNILNIHKKDYFKNLSHLNKLKELDISLPELNSIKYFSNINSLTKLSIHQNSITDFSGIEKNELIQELYFSVNELDEAINFSSIGKLKNLTQLSLNVFLSGSFQLDDISWLKNLKNLEGLRLIGGSISTLEVIQGLAELKSLSLSKTNVQDINPLIHLQKLRHLDLERSKIKNITPLKWLTQLVFLDLSHTDVDDISVLRHLINLDKIILDHTKIKNIEPLVPFIEKGGHIESKNSFEGISEFLGEIKRYLFIHGCQLNTPPQEIVQQGQEAILRFFKELYKGRVTNNETKLILVGNSTAGKTSLSLFLQEKKYYLDQNSTHGNDLIQIWHPKSYDLKVNIWDFGGQEYYHATHRLFLNENAVYVLVWEVETNENGFANTDIYYKDQGLVRQPLEHFHYTYWLDTIRHYASKSPVLMVCNKCELSPSLRIKDHEIQRFRLGPGDFEFSLSIAKAFEYHENNTNSQNKKWARTFEDFEEILLEKLNASAVKYTLVRYWVDIRDEIIHRSKNQRFLSWAEFEDLCKEYDEMPDAELAMIYLRDINGTVLHYPHNVWLKDKIFIDANWINQRIYTILNFEVKNRDGRFDLIHVQNVLNVEENEAMEMIELMRKFELIFEDSSQPEHYIAPQYLPHQPLGNFENIRYLTNLSPILSLRFPHFLPRSVITRFIARMGFHADRNQFWKFGIIFKQGLSALVECIYTNSPLIKIEIQSGEEKERKEVTKVIFGMLLEILEKESDFDISLEGGPFVSYQKLNRAYHEKLEKLFSCDEKVIERKIFDFLQLRKVVKKQRIFISYACEDSVFKDQLEKHLKILDRNGKIETWHHGEILPGANWDERIKSELNKADIILLLISTDFINSDYIWETDIKIALDQHKRKETVVIPILLRHCNLEGLEFMKLQVLPKGLEPVSSFPDPDKAWTQIAKEISRVVDDRFSQ